MKSLYAMSKQELVDYVLSVDERETAAHVKRQSKSMLICWIEQYRKYNEHLMTPEARELYVYTKDHFAGELNLISPTCVSPLVLVRRVVKKAIYQYVKEYCEAGAQAEDIFDDEDFQAASWKIEGEICNE